MSTLEASLKIPKEPKEGKIVLVVERDPFYRSFMESFLRGIHCELEFVMDGVAALKRMRVHKPDLFITEAILPKVDGLTLCRHIRAERGIADIPIIVFSILEIEDESLDAGADAFLLKPFKETAFARAVSKFLPMELKESAE